MAVIICDVSNCKHNEVTKHAGGVCMLPSIIIGRDHLCARYTPKEINNKE